jgi:hypothetical protein
MNNENERSGCLKLLENFAIGGIFISLIAISLIRIGIDDTPWHLSTAKYALSEGNWPICNTFSYTYPDYPLYQQYPIYQTILYFTYRAGGWEGLSLLHCISWIGIFLMWLKWSNRDSRQMKFLSLVWVLSLIGFQTRMILRPDILSIFLLISLVHFFDLYRKGRKWAAAFFVIVQLCMVNSHQLFPLGLGFQIVFLFHLIIVKKYGGRYGIAESDNSLPLLPALLAMGGSVLACFLSPLGTDIVNVVGHTLGSLQYYSKHVQELAPYYSDGDSLIIVIFASILGIIGIYQKRCHWQPFEIGLWIIASVVLSAGIRGVALYVMVCIGIFGRSLAETDFSEKATGPKHVDCKPVKFMFRVFCAFLTLLTCCGIVYLRWGVAARSLGNAQPGIGKALGVWPDETIKFLKKTPPPGKMINLSWYSGNALIFELFPQHRVFVDPRFEAYPREFMLQTIKAGKSREALESLVSQFQPDWMIAEVRNPDVRKIAIELIREKSWVLVHADTVLLTLVRNVSKNNNYIALHSLEPENIDPRDFLTSEPDLQALQQLVMAELFQDLGLNIRFREMIEAAQSVAGRYGVVQDALGKLKK